MGSAVHILGTPGHDLLPTTVPSVDSGGRVLSSGHKATALGLSLLGLEVRSHACASPTPGYSGNDARGRQAVPGAGGLGSRGLSLGNRRLAPTPVAEGTHTSTP